jgi:hypothetical protein
MGHRRRWAVWAWLAPQRLVALAPGKGPVLAPGQALDWLRPLPLDPDRGLAASLGL